MKTITFDYGPKRLHLYFNGNAMFAIDELNEARTDGQPSVFDLMQKQSAAGYGMLARVAQILAEQGELCRRYLCYAPERIPPADELLQLLTPLQMVQLRNAVIQAINNGYEGAADDESDDIDTGLAELEKKTRPFHAPAISR